MKRVVILGAFDRYNYGDNLMPILFEFFLKEFYPSFFERYELIFTALVNSDLSRYKAKKSTAMSEVFEKDIYNIQAIIVIGGEVLCASSSTLFLHMNHSEKLSDRISFLRRNKMSLLADIFCRRFYRLPWEYPYIPKKIDQRIRIGFNTVGGGVSRKSLGIYLHSVQKRFADADFLSVRDRRTAKSLQHFCSPELFPDSAIVMSRFVNDEFLENMSKPRINELKNEGYICFQAAPKKVGALENDCKEALKKISEHHGLKVLLCPIGYASGHDDVDFLREVQAASGGEFELLNDLNVWEIMSVIRYSKAFIGTSLHGIITALSFSVAHVGVNREVAKLEKFLEDWSIGASARCYSIAEIPEIFDAVINIDAADRQDNSNRLVELGIRNNHRLVQALGLDK